MTRKLLVALGCLVAAAGTALAQPDDAAQRKAGAEAAFRQAKDMLAKGDTAAACMAFKQSQALDPQFGTQYNLALCYEKWGKLASAWGELTELAARDSNTARRADADRRARALEPRLMRLLIVVKDRVPGLTVTRDGSDVTALVGVDTPVDPGMSRIGASAPGYKPWGKDVTIGGEGSMITVEVTPLEKAPVAPLPPVDDGRIPAGEQPSPPPAPPAHSGKSRRTLGLVIGGAGVVALAAGGLFGMQASSSFDDAESECRGPVTDCRGDLTQAKDHVDSARTQALLSNLGVGLGAAAVLGGAILYLTAPRDEASRPMVAPLLGGDRAGLAVTGRF
jgi:hypothetical protein